MILEHNDNEEVKEYRKKSMQSVLQITRTIRWIVRQSRQSIQFIMTDNMLIQYKTMTHTLTFGDRNYINRIPKITKFTQFTENPGKTRKRENENEN